MHGEEVCMGRRYEWGGEVTVLLDLVLHAPLGQVAAACLYCYSCRQSK